ncbi:hypothetical protein SAMN04489729_6157 [Amycolatopsis lurida]|uniref:Glycosyl hydrolase family 43 n=1 Tax=Amycolatopsis lurida NRRL 2430 TaxID=1460371 RepID=A0A2P2G174_AMYLU|nr:hypothetical protein [Amycolatopsis lurida]KFU82729.1 hypothetical protein BB31_03265 [Amycolatopsis lurida NRRL 2430]SEE04708.1 hypothetical protein SAMN04489729_6157 [Amycolatopsis lurida]
MAAVSLTALTLTIVHSPYVHALDATTTDWVQADGVHHVYSPASGQQYAYAPSAVVDSGHTYYYTCHNSSPGLIRDHVFFSQVDVASGTPQRDFAVLGPGGGGTWDSTHVCDPTVVAAKTAYRGQTYQYLMFFLGTAQDNTGNQIGLALANDLAGPWTKYPAPIVANPFEPGMWGVGQPSATTVNPEAGEVLLFYTAGGPTTTAWRRHLTLGDLDDPTIGSALQVTNDGITGSDGGADVLHNFDVVYDPPRDRFYAVRELGPYPGGQPSYISRSLEIDSIDGASIWNGRGKWRNEARISPETTGFPRNHNPGILRNIYGMLPSTTELTVVFTKSRTGGFPDSLWSYDLWRITGRLR